MNNHSQQKPGVLTAISILILVVGLGLGLSRSPLHSRSSPSQLARLVSDCSQDLS